MKTDYKDALTEVRERIKIIQYYKDEVLIRDHLNKILLFLETEQSIESPIRRLESSRLMITNRASDLMTEVQKSKEGILKLVIGSMKKDKKVLTKKTFLRFASGGYEQVDSFIGELKELNCVESEKAFERISSLGKKIEDCRYNLAIIDHSLYSMADSPEWAWRILKKIVLEGKHSHNSFRIFTESEGKEKLQYVLFIICEYVFDFFSAKIKQSESNAVISGYWDKSFSFHKSKLCFGKYGSVLFDSSKQPDKTKSSGEINKSSELARIIFRSKKIGVSYKTITKELSYDTKTISSYITYLNKKLTIREDVEDGCDAEISAYRYGKRGKMSVKFLVHLRNSFQKNDSVPPEFAISTPTRISKQSELLV